LANVDAIAHLRQGIALLATLPETPERIQSALTLQITLGPALMATRGTQRQRWPRHTTALANSASRPRKPQNSSRCCTACFCCIWDEPSMRRRGSSGSSVAAPQDILPVYTYYLPGSRRVQ
jgi:hypothetical protein